MATTPILSPAVRRALEAQQQRGHRADTFAAPDLGDRVRADLRFEPSEAEIASLIEDEREARQA